MISTRWLEKRKPYWARLEELANRSSRRGLRGLQHGELQELGLLYRQTASDLAIVREDNTSNQLSAYLNSLLGRAHNLIYMGHRPKISELRKFYSETYPQVFRETFPQTMLAFGIFLVTALAAFALTIHDPILRAPHAGRADDGYHRKARNVDSFHRDGEAAGRLRDHDQQSFRRLHHFCAGHHLPASAPRG